MARFEAAVLCLLLCLASQALGWGVSRAASSRASVALGVAPGRAGRASSAISTRKTALSMNLFEDAVRFFGNMNKEASAKHILMKGPGAAAKLETLKTELASAPDLSAAFSELAAKVSECPSATRGGNLGTFKPGMMVKEFDKVCFEEEVGKVHGPINTQFGAHLILITRRYEGEKK